MKAEVEAYLDNFAPEIKTFWLGGECFTWDVKTLQDHADYIYIRTLLGDTDWFTSESVKKYAEVIKELPLYGKKDADDTLLPHLTAYLLASLNLLAYAGVDVRKDVLGSITLDLGKFIDSKMQLPIWPKKWSHHTWRVSHWIGGVPSILLTFSRYDPKKQVPEQLVIQVLEACDYHILSDHNGLMKAYRSEFLQKLFRMAYRLRHNPEHGDIGGLVHVHWINHVTNRPYIAADKLIDRCMKDLQVGTFLEKMPYCLDFDYIQLLRTALEQKHYKYSNSIEKYIENFRKDLLLFLSNLPKEGYSLHKLPGALATLHETSLLLKETQVKGLDIPPIDIVKLAHWL